MEENPDFRLLPYLNRDGKTWGWRWHNSARNRDFGPTFPTMKKANTWLADTSADAVSRTEDTVSISDGAVAENDEDHELVYESDDKLFHDDSSEDLSEDE